MSDYGSTPPPPPGGGNYPPPPPGGGGYSAPPPAPGYGGAMSSPPPNYLVWAILSTIFCCLPLGIASIVFAAQVNGKWQAGDVAGAQDSSAKARKFAIWAAIAGIIVSVLYFVLVFAVGMELDGTSSTTM